MVFFIFLLCGNCFAQEVNKISVDTVRVKGYVVIYTNEKNDMGDTSFWYFFVKLNDMEEGFIMIIMLFIILRELIDILNSIM